MKFPVSIDCIKSWKLSANATLAKLVSIRSGTIMPESGSIGRFDRQARADCHIIDYHKGRFVMLLTTKTDYFSRIGGSVWFQAQSDIPTLGIKIANFQLKSLQFLKQAFSKYGWRLIRYKKSMVHKKEGKPYEKIL